MGAIMSEDQKPMDLEELRKNITKYATCSCTLCARSLCTILFGIVARRCVSTPPSPERPLDLAALAHETGAIRGEIAAIAVITEPSNGFSIGAYLVGIVPDLAGHEALGDRFEALHGDNVPRH